MVFKIGEKVVYPNHGIGVIEGITTSEVGGTRNSFYLLRLKSTESTVVVPIANASEIGLRTPIKTNQCERLLKALSADFSNPPVDWKERYKDFLEKMKTGDIFHVAEVLRNLTYLSQSKRISFREKRMLERARYLIISELSTVFQKNETVVERLVDTALCESCSKHTHSAATEKPSAISKNKESRPQDSRILAATRKSSALSKKAEFRPTNHFVLNAALEETSALGKKGESRPNKPVGEIAVDGSELRSFEFDVALSFAGEDRDYVSKVAATLNSLKVRIYYDEFQTVEMWGKDLYVYLDEIYRKKARYCILFLSSHYAAKAWTSHECKSAQARAFSSNQEYILPARFDSTEIPGILPTVAYVDLTKLTPAAFSEIILNKIGKKTDDLSIINAKGSSEGYIRNSIRKNKDYGTRFVEEELPKIAKKAEKEGTLPAVAFMDIDGLTLINKTFGREVGDAVVDVVYGLVRKRTLGKARYRGRCGDDTFYSVIFRAARVVEYCEKIREDVRGYAWRGIIPGLHVSCTVGYATLKSGEDPHEWLTRAILGMLEGKGRGCNIVQPGPIFYGMPLERKPAPQARPQVDFSKIRFDKIVYHSQEPTTFFSLRDFFS